MRFEVLLSNDGIDAIVVRLRQNGSGQVRPKYPQPYNIRSAVENFNGNFYLMEHEQFRKHGMLKYWNKFYAKKEFWRIR